MSKRHLEVPLSDQTQPRIRALVENSAPDPDRPRLSDEVERELEPTERQSAVCYADAENRTAKMRRLARDIRIVAAKK